MCVCARACVSACSSSHCVDQRVGSFHCVGQRVGFQWGWNTSFQEPDELLWNASLRKLLCSVTVNPLLRADNEVLLFFFSCRCVTGTWFSFLFFLFFWPAVSMQVISWPIKTYHRLARWFSHFTRWLTLDSSLLKKGKLLPSDNECVLKISPTQRSTNFFLFSHVFAFSA